MPGFEQLALQMPQGWELLILLGLVVLLFGAKKLPDAARGLGKSMRILKTETKALRDDEGTDSDATTQGTSGEIASATEAPAPGLGSGRMPKTDPSEAQGTHKDSTTS